MIRLAVFDMAGTTVNEDNLVYKAVQQAVNEKGFNFSLTEVLAVGAGKEKLQAIKAVLALRHVSEEVLAQEIFGRFQELLKDSYQHAPISEQPNATLLFQYLHAHKIKVVLNTGYDRVTAEGLLSKLNWTIGHQIDGLVTASDVRENRPRPDMILLAMAQQQIQDPVEVIKIGDSIIDIEEGKNAGCRFSIGITTGAHTREQLLEAAPDFIIDDLMELKDIVGRGSLS